MRRALALGALTAVLATAGCGAGSPGETGAEPTDIGSVPTETETATVTSENDASSTTAASPALTPSAPTDAATPASSGPSPRSGGTAAAGSAAASASSATRAADTGAQPGADSTCRTGSLSANVAPAEGGGAAGSVYWDVTLTNTGAAACTLSGYPGVSFTDASGARLGEPAERDGGQASPVELAPGEPATAPLRVTNPDLIAGCTPVTSASVVIYPPDQTESLTTPGELKVCAEQASTTIGVLSRAR